MLIIRLRGKMYFCFMAYYKLNEGTQEKRQ